MKKEPKPRKKEKARRYCHWCYLISFLWMLGMMVLAVIVEIPQLVTVLLMVPGCVLGLYGWGLLMELKELPKEERPAYCGFLDRYRIRDFPFIYLFWTLCWLLM